MSSCPCGPYIAIAIRFIVAASSFLVATDCLAQAADLRPVPTVTSWPDPTPTTVNPPQITAGQGITISPEWAIRNGGSAAASGFSVGVYLSRDATITSQDFRIGGFTGQSLDAGQMLFMPRNFSVPASVPAGTYRIGILADESAAVPESDESNNAVVIISTFVVNAPVNVDLRPRLRRLAAGNNWESATPDTTFELTPAGILFLSDWAVQNLGADHAPPFSIGFYLSTDQTITPSDMRLDSITIQDLPRLSTRNMQGTPIRMRQAQGDPVPPGDYFFGVLVDENGRVDEQVGGGETNNAAVTRVKILPGPPDTTRIWRAQVLITTGNTTHAGTDDLMRLGLHRDDNYTNMDYGGNDFKEGSARLYDLLLDGLSTFGDVQEIKVTKQGTDGWCASGLELRLNEVRVFQKDFSPCIWIGYGESYREILITYNELRRHPMWAAYAPLPLADLMVMTRADIESIVEANVGHSIAGSSAAWGRYHGRAVEVSRQSASEFAVDLDLKISRILVGEPELDVNFVIAIGCVCRDLELQVRDIKATVDSQWYDEVLSLGVMEWLDQELSSKISKRLSKHLSELNRTMDLGLGFCPATTITEQADLEFGLPPGAQLALTSSVSAARFRPGEEVALTTVIRNDGGFESGSYSTDVFLGNRQTSGSSGVRVGGTAGDSLGVCSEDRRTESIQLPTTLECTTYANRLDLGPVGRYTPRLPISRGRTNLFVAPPAYFLSVQLTSPQANATRDFSQHRLDIGLPDLDLPRPPALVGETGVPQVRPGSPLIIESGEIVNRGIFATDQIVVQILLSQQPGRQGARVLEQYGHSGLAPGESIYWPRHAVTIPPETQFGRYFLSIAVDQRNGEPECSTTNNLRSTVLEVVTP